MKANARPAQYTIRGVPPEVDRALRRRARERRVSLNQAIVDELTSATVGRRKYSDLGEFVGVWAPDPEFDRILEAQRQIDEDLWK